MAAKDSNGSVLNECDAVTVIKDLKLKVCRFRSSVAAGTAIAI